MAENDRHSDKAPGRTTVLRRAIWAGIAFTVVMAVFVGRLAWLQLLPAGSAKAAHGAPHRDGWKRMAVTQRQRSLVLDTGRGDFVDRYGRPITGETYHAVALFPVAAAARSDSAKIAELAAALEVPADELRRFWSDLREPKLWRRAKGDPPLKLDGKLAERISRLELDGVRVLPYRNRWPETLEPKHWIGFTGQHPEWVETAYMRGLAAGKHRLNEQVGGSGLEKSLDKLLHGVGETSVSFFVDGLGMPLRGLDMRWIAPANPYYPLRVVTTVDLDLQNEIEAYADREGLREGAIVVLDAANADVVAMVSRPQLKPSGFTSSDGSEWSNWAVRAVEPGSIYKLVTAAAALEGGAARPGDTFHCAGEYGKYGLSCWKPGGHGRITLQEGLAQSCNVVFASLAERMRSEQLERAADALGASGKVGWHAGKPFGPFARPLRLLEEEEPGRLFAAGVKPDGGVRAQSGIGQRDVRMSPLSAANLIVTLLNGGRAAEPRIVSEIRYADGRTMVRFPPKRLNSEVGRIRPATARALLRGMEAAVDHGTGRSIRGGTWFVAGKSGTAQTYVKGAERYHQWFAGYGPLESPRYAVAVLAANREPGSRHQATRLFRGVMDIAARHGRTAAGK